MAEYRQIQTRTWKDEWFLGLPPDFKLLFIYLFSNESASVAGIYEIAIPVMVFETGLSRERVEEGLAAFAAAGKAYYEDGVIWVKHLREYQASQSPKVRERIRRDLAQIADTPLRAQYIAYYGSDTPSAAPDTVSIGYPESASEQEQEQEHEREQEQDTVGARRAPSDLLAWLSRQQRPPTTFADWLQLLQAPPPGDNMVGVLMRLHQSLFPDRPVPKGGDVAALAKQLRGSLLASEMWELATRPPNGDVLAFIRGRHRRGRDSPGNGREPPRRREAQPVEPFEE